MTSIRDRRLTIRLTNHLTLIKSVALMLLCSWASAHLQHEPQVRTVLFASGTTFAYFMTAFIPIAAFPASEAPNWRIGAKLYLGFAVAAVFFFVGIHFLLKRDAKAKKEGKTKSDQDSARVGADVSA